MIINEENHIRKKCFTESNVQILRDRREPYKVTLFSAYFSEGSNQMKLIKTTDLWDCENSVS